MYIFIPSFLHSIGIYEYLLWYPSGKRGLKKEMRFLGLKREMRKAIQKVSDPKGIQSS